MYTTHAQNKVSGKSHSSESLSWTLAFHFIYFSFFQLYLGIIDKQELYIFVYNLMICYMYKLLR